MASRVFARGERSGCGQSHGGNEEGRGFAELHVRSFLDRAEKMGARLQCFMPLTALALAGALGAAALAGAGVAPVHSWATVPGGNL